MSNGRPAAQPRPDKSPSRAKLDLRRHQKLLRRTNPARGTSAPARTSASPELEGRRSTSPLRSLGQRPECVSHRPNHDARLSRGEQRRRLERRCQSETCTRRYSRTSPIRATFLVDYEEEALRHLCLKLITLDEQDGEHKARDFADANLDPPITKLSLSELDIASIITNSKLRHDVNFDRELHFRPNLDGVKGRAKRKAQADYWSALIAELDLYTVIAMDPSHLAHPYISSTFMRRACSRRIPRMFEAAKDILKALVPESDHDTVDLHLDIPMIMQEIGAGVCDLPSIARWLARTLKAHCAPMRDHIIDKMVKYIDRGVLENKTKYLVEGMVQMFGAMEAMKLDVANHQIRQLRITLLEDTVNFEQKHHIERITRGRIDVTRARFWYHEASSKLSNERKSHDDENVELPGHNQQTSFLSALLDTILSPVSATFPDTFKLDAERLKGIRSDLYDLFCIDAADAVFHQLVGPYPVSSAQKASFRSIISTIVNQSFFGSSWEDNIENIAAEMDRQIEAVKGCCTGQDGHTRDRAEQLLRRIFSDATRSFFFVKAQATIRQLLPPIQAELERYERASLVEVFNTFLPSPNALPAQRQRPVQPHDTDSVMADVTRRIAHIAILHWRVWAPIVYLNGPPPIALPNRQPTSAAMSRSSSARESPAPPQFLASAPQVTDAPHSAQREDEVPASDMAEQTPRTVANSHTQAPVDDASSPALYRQRTN